MAERIGRNKYEARRNRKRRERIRKYLLILGGILAASAILFFVLSSPLFAVQEVKIENENKVHVLDDKVLTTAGIAVGDNIWTVRVHEVEKRLYVLPWVSEVTVKRKFPKTVVIRIEESEIAGYVGYGDKLMAIDKNAKTITTVDIEDRIMPLPVFWGVSFVMPDAGMPLIGDEAEKTAVLQERVIRAYLALTDKMERVSYVDISDPTSVEMVLLSEMRVKMGDDTELPYKFAFMQSALSQISSNAKGVLDIRHPETGSSYRPATEQ